MGKRIAFGLVGYGVGWLPFVVLWAFTGKFRYASALWLGVACSNFFLYIAERKGKLKSIGELDRPLTLFPRDHS
jgi:hypothetical protein